MSIVIPEDPIEYQDSLRKIEHEKITAMVAEYYKTTVVPRLMKYLQKVGEHDCIIRVKPYLGQIERDMMVVDALVAHAQTQLPPAYTVRRAMKCAGGGNCEYSGCNCIYNAISIHW